MKRKAFTALVLLGLYLAVFAFPMMPDRLILFPTTERIDAGSAVRQAIPFQDGELELWTAPSRLAREKGQPDFYVLRFYGNADRAERWVADEAEMWGERAVEVWGMNYPGYGGSTGPARLSSLGSAALTAFDALKETAGDRPVLVFGASLGATTALHVAAQRPVAGVILQNPPPIREMIIGQFGWWNLWLLAAPWSMRIPGALDSVSNAKASHAHTVFLLAENDEVVAPKFQALVVNAYAGEKRVLSLRGASHNSPMETATLGELAAALPWLLEGRRN